MKKMFKSILLLLAAGLFSCAEKRSCQDAPEKAPEPEKSDGGAEASGFSRSSAMSESKEPADSDLVALKDFLPEAHIDLRYATEDNFTGRTVYEDFEAQLRYGTVKKLKKVVSLLAERGFTLKIWDAYRPVSAQFKLWEICPDPRFVADPTKGFSDHSRGGTLDCTLCDSDGAEVEMPSGFDDFSDRANRDYSDCPPEAAANARLLEEVMRACGFVGYETEWWHYNDADRYEVVFA